MCTTAAKRLDSSWFLIKTRDPVSWMRWDDEIKLFNSQADKYKKLIVQNPNPNEDGYYGGINERGVAIIATYITVSENQISYIRRPYVRLILDAQSAEEAIKIIKLFNPRISGNIFVADSNECYGIEGVSQEYFIEKIDKPTVKTNHYRHLPYENLQYKTNSHFKEWTYDHFNRASELIIKAKDLADLEAILRDRKNADRKTAICTTRKEKECFTYSAFIFDTRNKTAYYCQGNPSEKPFKKYHL